VLGDGVVAERCLGVRGPLALYHVLALKLPVAQPINTFATGSVCRTGANQIF
jgi:hypothetical protein